MKISMTEVRDIAEIVKVLTDSTQDTGIVQATIEVRLNDERGVVITFDEGDEDWAFEVLDYTDVEDGDLDVGGDLEEDLDPNQTTLLPIPSLAEEQAGVTNNITLTGAR